MSLADGDLRTAPRRGPARDWRQGQSESSPRPDRGKEHTMSTFINNATVALLIAASGISSLSMVGAVMAGVLGA